MLFKFGIREKLLVPLFLGLAVIICVLFFFWQPSQLEKTKQQFIESQSNILKTLTPSIIQNLLANDLSELHRVFENSQDIHKNEWRYIQLTNPDNKQLYPIFSNKPEDSSTLIKIYLTIEENDEIFGYITLYTDWKKTRNKERENINQLSLLSILLFSIIAVGSFILQTKWIYTPISKLKELTSEFSLGRYDAKLPKISADEIGLLTSSIDQMRDKIQFTMNELVDGEKMQRAILESVPDAIITINTKGIIQSFNPSAEKTFKYNANEVIGNNIKMLMPEEIANHHDQYINNFQSSDKAKVIGLKRDLFGVRQDGSQFPIELTINAKVIDNEYIFTGIIRDITEQKEVDRLKNEFVSTVSHELRTPLTAIKGAIDIITKGLNLELPEQATLMLDVANRNIERLLTLINDILDISKLESGEINFMLENIEIEHFLGSCVELNQEYAKKHNTEFRCMHIDKNIMVNVDKDRLAQVMSNLLSNAAKYSPENIPVEVFTQLIDKTLRVSVKDYGKGIPKEFQPILFEKFTQSSSGDTRQVGGTGLGLNISKMIIEKSGGKIGFDTTINKQTTFYFELPIVY